MQDDVGRDGEVEELEYCARRQRERRQKGEVDVGCQRGEEHGGADAQRDETLLGRGEDGVGDWGPRFLLGLSSGRSQWWGHGGWGLRSRVRLVGRVGRVVCFYPLDSVIYGGLDGARRHFLACEVCNLLTQGPSGLWA